MDEIKKGMWPKMTSSYPMMSSIFFPKQRRKFQIFQSSCQYSFFLHILEFLDFSHVGMIYESEITKTMKGLLNGKAHRSYFSTGKKSSSMYLGKLEKSKKKSKFQNYQKFQIFNNYHHHQQSTTAVVALEMMNSNSQQ